MDNIAPFLSDAEVYELCFPLRMPAAQVRFLRNRLRLHVSVKPNGRPIVMRSELERVIGASRLGAVPTKNPQATPDVASFEQWARERKHGKKEKER